MVPMAPSSTRIRSRAAASKAVRLGEAGTVIVQAAFCAPVGRMPSKWQIANTRSARFMV